MGKNLVQGLFREKTVGMKPGIMTGLGSEYLFQATN